MTTQSKFYQIESELNSLFIDREQEIRGLILAALSRKHIELLGPPGNAKSAVIREMTARIQGNYFGWLMTEDTSPDEILGPVDIRALKEGVYRRVTTRKMPESEVCYLDEVYKANSQVLNAMLGILQERKFNNNGTEVDCPLVFAVGSSNELPEEEAHLQAFRDRFLLRYNPGYFTDSGQLEQMLIMRGKHPPIYTLVDKQELKDAWSEIDQLNLSSEAVESIKLVWERLRDEGIVCSPRRYNQMVDVMATDSWLLEQSEIVADSVLVGEHILWTKPEDIRLVSQVVRSSVNPNLTKAQDILLAAKESISSLTEYTTRDELIQLVQETQHMVKEIVNIETSGRITQIKDELDKMSRDIMNKMFESIKE